MASKSTAIHFKAIEGDVLRQTVVSGAVSLTVADIVVQAINYGIQIGLARYFTPAEYGTFGIIASIFVLLQVVLRWGLPRAIAYFVAQDRNIAQDILKKAIGLQAVFGLSCFLIFYWAVDKLTLVLGDPALYYYLLACAPFILTFALVPVYGGFLNGLGAFPQLAGLQVISHLVKLLLVMVLLYAGTGIYGVIAAYTVSPLIIIGYGLFFVRARPSLDKKKLQVKSIVAFGIPLFVAALAISFVMRIDLFMVQSILADEIQTGLYTAASSLMRGPYFLTVGAGAVFFRMAAQLRAESHSKVREFVSRVARYYFLALAPVPVILYATAEETIRMVFGNSYLTAVPVFKVLSFCLAFMVLYHMVTTLIAALSRPQFAMILALLLIPVQVLLIYIGITHGLVGVALATTLTWGLGTLVGIVYLLREGCVTLPGWKTFLNITVASICAYSVALWFSPHGLWLLIFYPCAYLSYLAYLKLAGEIGPEEMRLVHLTWRPAKQILQ
jgi:O-antigen/teichoic acid export membrane protein